MLKAIIFDFDGVIVESVEVKTEAFRQLFGQYPQHLDEILTYHKINGGISRYVKFQHIHQTILKEPLSETGSKKLGELFSQYALEEVIRAPFVQGAQEFLKEYYQRVKLFIVSGTPEDEMRLITQKRDLNAFFKGVYGSPRSKAELSRMILKENGLFQEDVIFVGDSVNDLDGAQEAGIRFIGRLHPQENNPFKGLDKSNIINDINELKAQLSREKLLPGS